MTAHHHRQADRWLLCSDGLTDYVPEADIHEMLAAHDAVEDAVSACVALALETGTRDNVTVVVVDVLADADTGDATAGPEFYGAAAERFMEGLESA